MSLASFRQEFPGTVLVAGDEGDGAWLVSTQEVCFPCESPNGFQRSTQVYARVARFENGRLVKLEPIESVSPP